mgnify:CR=1 FL=1
MGRANDEVTRLARDEARGTQFDHGVVICATVSVTKINRAAIARGDRVREGCAREQRPVDLPFHVQHAATPGARARECCVTNDELVDTVDSDGAATATRTSDDVTVLNSAPTAPTVDLERESGCPTSAVSFDGDNDYVDLGDVEIGGAMSVAVWARLGNDHASVDSSLFSSTGVSDNLPR